METYPQLTNKDIYNTFYPTYKEWKHSHGRKDEQRAKTFYPTYKEWKLRLAWWSDCLFQTFYPTYKEWKRPEYTGGLFVIYLFILPIRNGNCIFIKKRWNLLTFYPTYKEWKLSNFPILYSSTPKSFYPTYKEWKHRNNSDTFFS